MVKVNPGGGTEPAGAMNPQTRMSAALVDTVGMATETAIAGVV